MTIRTTLSFDIEVEHEGDLNLEKLKTEFIGPVQEGIRTAAAFGPGNLKNWEPKSVHIELP